MRKPQEGMSNLRGADKLLGVSRLRGAARRSLRACAGQPAWVDAGLLAWCEARAAMKARGRRQGATPVASQRDKTLERNQDRGAVVQAGTRISARTKQHEGTWTRLFEREVNGKGTAMVANKVSIVPRVPRPRDGNFRGSSGGQATDRPSGTFGTSLESGDRSWNSRGGSPAKNPKSGAEHGDGLRQMAGGGRRQSRRNGKDGIGRGWNPGARIDRESGLSTVRGRCLRLETLKGKETP